MGWISHLNSLTALSLTKEIRHVTYEMALHQYVRENFNSSVQGYVTSLECFGLWEKTHADTARGRNKRRAAQIYDNLFRPEGGAL